VPNALGQRADRAADVGGDRHADREADVHPANPQVAQVVEEGSRGAGGVRPDQDRGCRSGGCRGAGRGRHRAP
jgi:hypothetical protein